MFRHLAKLPPRTYLVYGDRCPRTGQAVRFAQGVSNPQCPPPKGKASTGSVYTLSAVAVVSLATIGYAKYDPEFRKLITNNVPYSDKFFKFIFQEDKPIGQHIVDSVTDLFQSPVKKEKSKIMDTPQNYDPPRPVFPGIAEADQTAEKYNEIRVSKTPSSIETVKEKPKPAEKSQTKTLAELEEKIGVEAKSVVETLGRELNALRHFNQEVESVMENSKDSHDPRLWQSLKAKSDEKERLSKEAADKSKQVMDDLVILKSMVDDPNLEAMETSKETVRRNIDRLLEDIVQARQRIVDEKNLSYLTDKYWQKVRQARCHFIEELEILFPEIDINNKKMSLKPEDLDLFVVHLFSTVMFYQKELAKADMMNATKFKVALDAVKVKEPGAALSDVQLQEALEREKRALAIEYQKKCLALRQDSERELRHRLKCQAEAHVDHLKERLEMQEREMERTFNRKLDEQLTNEELKYKRQLAAMVGRVNGITHALRDKIKSEEMTQHSQVLWSACQALQRTIKMGLLQTKPLREEINAIRQAAPAGDELISAVLRGIPEEAVTRGVLPEHALRERFLKVAQLAKRLALVPDTGANLPTYALSYFQSVLLIDMPNPIPSAELADEKVDFTKLNNHDVLQRARYWLDRGNYMQALRYMNLLNGASRCVADQWIQETRILLETQQAAETLMAHAVAGGLKH